MRGSCQILRSLSEARRATVQSAGHFSNALADGSFRFIQQTVRRCLAPFLRIMPANTADPDAPVDREQAVRLAALMTKRCSCGRALRRGEKRLPPHPLCLAKPLR